MSSIRIVIANNSLAGYPEAGGLWMWLIQYLLGLRDLGHEVLWLELLRSTGSEDRDAKLMQQFFERFSDFGVAKSACIVRFPIDASCDLNAADTFGMTSHELTEYASSADLLWNIAASLRQPLLSLFRRRVLIDVDPGHLQVSAIDFDMGIQDHDVFFTVGYKMNDPDCQIPRLGLNWQTFLPFLYLPLWKLAPPPDCDAPIVSVTQWNWGELHLGGRSLSISKRDAYMRHASLPGLCDREFELAANIHPQDQTGDRETLKQHGWKLVNPHEVVRTPAMYQDYINRSYAELSCPKPIFRELRTGWLSDRSACFLAAGRPVLAEDTGISDHLPSNQGLVTFKTTSEAADRVAEIDGDYCRHSSAARRFAVEYLDSRQCLSRMLVACG